MMRATHLRIPPLALLFAAVIIDLIGYGIVIPLLPVYVQRLGGGATLVGALGALYALVQGLCGPLLGAASDRHGRRPVLALCLAGTGLGYLLLASADALWLLALALLLDATTGANLSVAQAYLADSSPPERRARDFGLLGVAFALGVTAGPALAGLLSGLAPQAPALAAAGMAGANLALVLLALPESLPPERRQAAPGGALAPLALLRGWRPEGRALGGLLLTTTLVNLAFSGLQSNFPVFSRARFGWDTATIAYFFAFVGACAVLTQGLLVGLLRRRLSDMALACGGAALMALGLPALGLAPAPWMLYPLAALVALGSSLCIPSLSSMLSARAGEAAQGRLMGAQQVAINLALVLGPLAAGLAFDRVGAWAPATLGGLCALAARAALIRAR